MSAYYSSYFQTIDEKGRIVLPGKLRKIAELECDSQGKKLEFIVKFIKATGGLALFTVPAWEPLQDRYKSYSILNAEELKQKVKFFMRVEQVPCDRQGRMNISSYLMKKAGLKDKVVIVGVGDHIELFSEEQYKKLDEEDEVV